MFSIRLPNFFEDKALNTLKIKMGIDRETYGNFGNSKILHEKRQLKSKGVDIEDISNVTPLADHTLVYGNERVILYIRDVSDWGDVNKLPKFHIAYCSTLQSMAEIGRKKRYVVTQNESGFFHLNYIDGNSIREAQASLDVCKNCLEILSWNNYTKKWDSIEKDKCVQNFKISDFFLKYPKSLINDKGYSRKHSALNQYPDNWKQISSDYRESKNWRCEQCGVNLINSKYLLHTHHINAQKNECQFSNLIALCVDCHSRQPMHSHMHNNPQLEKEILKIKQLRSKQGI